MRPKQTHAQALIHSGRALATMYLIRTGMRAAMVVMRTRTMAWSLSHPRQQPMVALLVPARMTVAVVKQRARLKETGPMASVAGGLVCSCSTPMVMQAASLAPRHGGTGMMSLRRLLLRGEWRALVPLACSGCSYMAAAPPALLLLSQCSSNLGMPPRSYTHTAYGLWYVVVVVVATCGGSHGLLALRISVHSHTLI